MHRLTIAIFAVYQTAWVRFIIWVVFNNFAVEDGMKYLIKSQIISSGFFICVIGDPYSITAYSLCNVADIH